MNNKEYRMYSLVLRQLTPIQKGVQTTHGVVEYANNYSCTPEYRQWAEHDKTLIMLDGGTAPRLNNIIEILKDYNIRFSTFQEPDLNNLTTSICFLADEEVWSEVYDSVYETEHDYDDEFNKIYKLRKIIKSCKLSH